MLVLLAAFSESVRVFTSERYINRLTPLLILTGALFGSLGVAAAVVRERESGLLDHLRAMPIPAIAVLGGRVVGDFIRAVAVAAVLGTVGHVFGSPLQ